MKKEKRISRVAYFFNNYFQIPVETINKCLFFFFFFTYQSFVKMLGELGWRVTLILLLAVLYDDQGSLPMLAEAIV